MKKVILCSLLSLLMGGASYGEIPQRALSSESTFKKVAYLCAYLGHSGLALEGNNTTNTSYSWNNPRYTPDSSLNYDALLDEMNSVCKLVYLEGVCGDLVPCSGMANQVYAYCDPSKDSCTSGSPRAFSDYNQVTSW